MRLGLPGKLPDYTSFINKPLLKLYLKNDLWLSDFLK